MQQLGEFVINHWHLFAALVILAAMLIGGPINRRLRGFEEVDPQTAVGLINREDAVLVDVREDSEYRDGHVPESLHVALSTLDQNLSRLEKFRQTPVIVGCRSGSRSNRAAAILRKNGFEKVYNLRGGMLAWENAGLPLSKGKAKKKRKAANH